MMLLANRRMKALKRRKKKMIPRRTFMVDTSELAWDVERDCLRIPSELLLKLTSVGDSLIVMNRTR